MDLGSSGHQLLLYWATRCGVGYECVNCHRKAAALFFKDVLTNTAVGVLMMTGPLEEAFTAVAAEYLSLL